MTRFRSAAFFFGTTALAGCSALLDFDSRRTDGSASDGGGTPPADDASGATDASDSGGVVAEAGADAADAALACPGTAGPTPVRVGSYCIDSTEVTNTQYALFLAAAVPVGSQTGPCTGNTTFVPMNGQPPANAKPVIHVDWCDAFAYCKWANKRLCGKIGGGSATINVQAESQWYQACSMGGTLAYPYGAYSPTACVTGSGPQDAGGTPTCTGGYQGLFDMSGNAGEWEDACDANNRCAVRGGAFDETAMGTLRCDSQKSEVRTEDTHSEVGFRCCSP